jgi:hypothetical protein
MWDERRASRVASTSPGAAGSEPPGTRRPARVDVSGCVPEEPIDGAIGELSMFHETFGYYADGVGEATATLPEGWKDRLVPIRTPGTLGNTGLALEVHDLLISKYVAGRDKDRRFARSALVHGLVDPVVLEERLSATPVEEQQRARIRALIAADVGARS